MTSAHAFLRTAIQTRSWNHTATGVVCYRFGLAGTSTFVGEDGAPRFFDYSRRTGIIATGWAAPPSTDASWSDPLTWAHRIEAVDRRKNSRQCRDDVIGIPIELVEAGLAEQALQAYAERLAQLHNTVVIWSYHGPARGGKNHHGHVLYPGRHVEGLGFSKRRDREQDRITNEAYPDRVDITIRHKATWTEICRGYGIELRWSSEHPGHHLGPKICSLKRKRLVGETSDAIGETIAASGTDEAVPGRRVLDSVAAIATGVDDGLTVNELLQIEQQHARQDRPAPRAVAAPTPHLPEVVPPIASGPEVLLPVRAMPRVLPVVWRGPEVFPPLRLPEVLLPVREMPRVLPVVWRGPEVLPPLRLPEVLLPVRAMPRVLPVVLRGLEVLPPLRLPEVLLPVRAMPRVLPVVLRGLEVLPPVRLPEVLLPVRAMPHVSPVVSRPPAVLPPVSWAPEIVPPLRRVPEVVPPLQHIPEVLPPTRAAAHVLPPVRKVPEMPDRVVPTAMAAQRTEAVDERDIRRLARQLEVHVLRYDEENRLLVSNQDIADLTRMLINDDDDDDTRAIAALEQVEAQHADDAEERVKAVRHLYWREIELVMSGERRQREQEAKSKWSLLGRRTARELNADERRAIERDVIRKRLPRLRDEIRSFIRRMRTPEPPPERPSSASAAGGEHEKTRRAGYPTR